MKNWKLEGDIRSYPKLKMKDLVREISWKYIRAIWFCGTKQIEGAFSTPDVECCGDRFLPFCSCMKYHRAVVVKIPHQSLLGEQVLNVVCLEARRLQCGLTGPKRQYLQKCRTLCQEHKV